MAGSQEDRDRATELLIIEGASHIDLYDEPEYVPLVVDKPTEFYGEYL